MYILQSLGIAGQDSFDDRDSQRERSESNEWRDDGRYYQDGSFDNRRNISRDDRSERSERSERPQRPDSRDSRTSRESKTFLREEDFHKSRDSDSWVDNHLSDYEEKKVDSIGREDVRERDARHPPGPITREKLEADELQLQFQEKRTSLTQLQRRGSVDQEKKIDSMKDSTTTITTIVDSKKETKVWNRKLERTPPDNSRNETCKAWADAVSPTFDKRKEEEEKLEPIKDDKTVVDLKQSMEKLSVDKRGEDAIEESKDDNKDVDKRREEKSCRNRTNSASSRGGGGRGDSRGRQWGGFNVYNNQRWRGSDNRGRRGGSGTGGARISARPGSARSGSYGHTDSEVSGDEVSSSAELPTTMEEERRPKSPKSLSQQKGEKEDRNREMSRRDDDRIVYSQSSKSGGDKRAPRGYDARPTREGFAPSGEPSRRGRGGGGGGGGGGYRMRGTTTRGTTIEGYGPPSSKSPFSSERNMMMDEKNIGQQNPTTASESSDPNNGVSNLESVDDKTIAKQQALTAGITGRHTNKSPNQQITKQEINHANAASRNQTRKEESRPKRNHSGNRKVSERYF